MLTLARLLRAVAVICTVIIGLSWVMFATDQASKASNKTQQEIEDVGRPAVTTPGQPQPPPAEKKKQTSPRTVIDDAASALLRPFRPIVAGTDNVWAKRTLPTLIGILLYGFVLGMLARTIVTRA